MTEKNDKKESMQLCEEVLNAWAQSLGDAPVSRQGAEVMLDEMNVTKHDGNFRFLVARDVITAALRDRLADLIRRNEKKLGAEVAEKLSAWAKESNPEALAEWLKAGGKNLVDGERLDSCVIAAASDYSERQKRFLIEKHPPDAPELKKAATKVLSLNIPTESLLLSAKDEFIFFSFNMKAAETETEAGKLKHSRAAMLASLVHKSEPDTLPENKSVIMLAGKDALISAFTRLHFEPLEKLINATHAGNDKGIEGVQLAPTQKKTNWLGVLIGPWFEARVNAEKAEEAARIKRDALAVPFGIRSKAQTQYGNQWTPIPRAMDIAAAMGGPMFIEQNGETYAPEPHLAPVAVGRALRPRCVDIVPADWLENPAQLTLAMDYDSAPEAVREYIVETATRTAQLAQFPNLCPKLLGFMFGAAPMTGRPVKGDLLELAKWMYPYWATGQGQTVKPWKERRQKKRDLKRLGTAFVSIKTMRMMDEKPDRTRHPYDLFTIDYDLSTHPESLVGWMINPWLVQRMQGGRGGGYFMLCMTRWLTLSVQNPRIFPLALRLAAIWDGARQGGIYNPDRLRPIEADRLAAACNTLPDGAAMYRAGKTDAASAKTALAIARANMVADLDVLKEAGMLGNWGPTRRKDYGRGFNFMPLPPEDYPEACKRATAKARKQRRQK